MYIEVTTPDNFYSISCDRFRFEKCNSNCYALLFFQEDVSIDKETIYITKEEAYCSVTFVRDGKIYNNVVFEIQCSENCTPLYLHTHKVSPPERFTITVTYP